MANKIKKGKSKSGEDDFESEFDDMSSEFDDMDFSNEVEAKSRKPARGEIGKSFLKGAGTEFKSSVIEKLAKKSLPDEFETYSSDLSDLSSFAGETLDQAKTKLKKPLARIAKETKKFIPENFKTINGWMDKILEHTDEGQYQQQSEDAARDSQITGELSNIFDKQIEVQKALAAREEATADTDRKINLNNIKRTQDLLTDISASSATINAFNMQIAKEYYKKSLELQFRSYYIQADTLRSIKEHYPIYKSQFDAIIKNTGLPDYVKIKTDEKYFETIRQQTMESFNKNLMGNNAFINNVKKNITNAVKNKMSDVSYALDNISDAMSGIGDASEMTGESKSGMLSGIMGSIMGSTATDWLGKKVGDKIKPHLAKSATVTKAKNLVSAYATSPQVAAANAREGLQSYKNELENQESETKGFGASLMNKLKQLGASGGLNFLDLTRGQKQDKDLDKENIMTTKTPAVFDQMVYRSITHVIPLYLAHILKENQALSKHFKAEGGELLDYDYNKRKLSTTSDIQNSYSKFLQKSAMGDKVKNTAESIIASSGANKSGDRKKELTKTLEEYLREATAALPQDQQTHDIIFAEKPTNDIIKKLREKYSAMKEVIADMEKAGKTVEGAHRLKQSSKQLLGTNNAKEIQALFKLASDLAGMTEMQLSGEHGNLKELTVSEEECVVLNFSLTKFIIDEQRDLTIARLPDAFKYVVSDENLINKTALMLTIIKAVTSKSQFKTNYSLIVTKALGDIWLSVINSLASNRDQMATIYGINPGIFDYDKVSSGNLIGLTFGKTEDYDKDDKKTDFQKLTTEKGGFLRMSDKVQAAALGDSLEKTMLANLTAFSDKMKTKGIQIYSDVKETAKNISNSVKEIKAAGNDPKLQAALIKKLIDNSFDTVQKAGKEIKEKALAKLDTVSTALTQFSNNSRNKLLVKLNDYTASINTLIAQKESEIEVMVNVETQLNTAVREQFDGAKTIDSIHTKWINEEITALKKISGELTALSESIAKIDFNFDRKTVNIAAMKNSYKALVTRVKAAITTITDNAVQFNNLREQHILKIQIDEADARGTLENIEQ